MVGRTFIRSARGRAGVLVVLVVCAGLAGGISSALSASPGVQQAAGACPSKAPAGVSPPQWPAARHKLAPHGASTIQLCRYSGLNAHPALALTHARAVTRTSRIQTLIRELDALPHGPRGPVACPADDGSEILALLAYPKGQEVTIEVRLTGCRPATNGRVSRMATSRLIRKLERLVDGGAGR